MIPRTFLRRSLTAGVLLLATALPAQQSCDPRISLRGVPCICETVTFVLENNPGCHDCLTLSLDPTPVTLPGGLHIPGSPPYFVLHSSVSTGQPTLVTLPIPCEPGLIGQPVVGLNASWDQSGVLLSRPIEFRVCGGQIGDTVFCDVDGNGRRDPNDPPLVGVTVSLECDNQVVATTTTAPDGSYLFDRLPLGECRVFVEPSLPLLRKVVTVNCPPEYRVDLHQTPTFLDADFCYTDCNPCDGKATVLLLRYDGSVADATITVEDKDHRQLFQGIVQPGSAFVVRGMHHDTTLTDEITLWVNGGSEQDIRTKCDDPLGPGMSFGPYTVIAGESRHGGPLCEPSPCSRGKPCSLTLRYLGGDCSATTHNQDPGKVSCTGDAGNAAQVRIRVSDDSDPHDHGAKVWFDGPVTLGSTFVAEAANASEDRLKSATFVHVFDQGGALLQTVEFHTSCSQPLLLGDRFGSVRLEGFQAEGECGSGTPDLCNGRPVGVRLEYNGQPCAATMHAQDPGKVTCSGDPGMAASVLIRVSDKADPNDQRAKVWFSGIVGLHQAFDATALNVPGSSRLSSNSFVHVFDATGRLLQQVEFHTSCSQPLRVDDQFGSVRLLGLLY